jgi:hypothetical protein
MHVLCRSLREGVDSWVYKTFETAIESGLAAIAAELEPELDGQASDDDESAVTLCPTPAEFRERMLEPVRLLLKSMRHADPKTAGKIKRRAGVLTGVHGPQDAVAQKPGRRGAVTAAGEEGADSKQRARRTSAKLTSTVVYDEGVGAVGGTADERGMMVVEAKGLRKGASSTQLGTGRWPRWMSLPKAAQMLSALLLGCLVDTQQEADMPKVGYCRQFVQGREGFREG